MATYEHEHLGGPHDGHIFTAWFAARTGDVVVCPCHEARHDAVEREGRPTLLIHRKFGSRVPDAKDAKELVIV